jgi:predicted nicotinamide N-methyase
LGVDALERYVDREALLRDANAPEPPYWAHLWTASRALANHVASVASWQGKRVIDIGSGLGLLSVVAALKGADVTAIDMAPEAVAMTSANAALNGCRVSATVADLRKDRMDSGFDYCLAADVTYDPSLQNALAAFFARHLAADGIGWCAESVRTHDRGFREACVANRLRVDEIEVTEVEDGRPVTVRIAEVRHG